MPAESVKRAMCVVAGVSLCALVRADTEIEFDFLDYLGEMVEVEGDWVDPVALDTDIALAAESSTQERSAVTDMQITGNDATEGPGDAVDEKTGEL